MTSEHLDAPIEVLEYAMDGRRFDAFASTSASAKKGEMTAAMLAHTLESDPSMAPLDTYGCLNSPESPLSSIDCLGSLSRVHDNPLFSPECPSLVNSQNALKGVMDLREAYTVEPRNFDHIEEVVAGPSGHQPEPIPLLYDEKANDCQEGRTGTPELHFADPIACEEISQDNIPIEAEAHSMPHIAESDVILEPVSTLGNPNLNPSAENRPPKASIQGNGNSPPRALMAEPANEPSANPPPNNLVLTELLAAVNLNVNLLHCAQPSPCYSVETSAIAEIQHYARAARLLAL
jgi:hypothetical protein